MTGVQGGDTQKQVKIFGAGPVGEFFDKQFVGRLSLFIIDQALRLIRHLIGV